MAVPAASSTALAGFYREHHGWLLGWLRRRTHNADCAADLTQDTFLRLLSRRVVSIRPNCACRVLTSALSRTPCWSTTGSARIWSAPT